MTLTSPVPESVTCLMGRVMTIGPVPTVTVLDTPSSSTSTIAAGVLPTQSVVFWGAHGGFPLIAQATGIYGNIDGTPAANSWWRANVRAVTGSPTRQTVLRDIVSATKAATGEAPNIGVMGPGTWELLS